MRIFVIFGAAVRPDGSPSLTLRRRVEGAWHLARGITKRRFICSGRVGRYPPAEAEVMQQLLLEFGAQSDEIILDTEAGDTLDTIVNSRQLLAMQGPDWSKVMVCSSRFHQPRCVLLFRLAGIPAFAGRMPADRPGLGFAKWLYLVLREPPALVWDSFLIVWRRMSAQL